MTRNKNTKQALLASIMSLALCFAMLIGTTFAWFTDNASTGVNKIQAGNLKIKLQKKVGDSWADVGGEKLNFIASDNRENILWEPGATYVLPALKITNEGNLWLKYKVEVSGVDKTDAKLLEAIDFYVAEEELGTTNRPDLTTLTKLEDYFKYDETTPKTLAPQEKAADGKVENETESTKVFTIVGHMREDAGNEYNQKDANGNGLSVEGIAIKVVAAQFTAEKDSFDDQYDKDALMPLSVLNEKEIREAIASAKAGERVNIVLANDIDVTKTIATKNVEVVIDGNGKTMNANTKNDAGQGTPVFAINNLSLSNVTIKGNATYAIYREGGRTVLNNVTIDVEDNLFACNFYGSGEAVLNNCSIKGDIKTQYSYGTANIWVGNRATLTVNGGEYGSVFVNASEGGGFSSGKMIVNDGSKIDKVILETTINKKVYTDSTGVSYDAGTAYKSGILVNNGGTVGTVVTNPANQDLTGKTDVTNN